jgi:hypothetical protein
VSLFLVTFTTFIQCFLATLEMRAISLGMISVAVMIVALCSSARFVATVLIVEEKSRWRMMMWYVAADVAATWLALTLWKGVM